MASIENQKVNMTNIMMILILLLFCVDPREAANPTGCTSDQKDSSVTHYLCDMTAVGSSISFSGFTDSQPQRLTLYNVAHSISSSTFNGFGSFTIANLNEDFPATLQFLCKSTLTFAAGTFTNLGYMQEIVMNDCVTSLIASHFTGLTTVNSVRITGGTLSSIDAGTFTSLSIAPIASVEDPQGELIIRNVVLTPGTFPSTFFSPLTKVKKIYLEKLGLTTVDAAWFTSNVALVYLSLANNAITTLPATVFNSLTGLIYVKLEGNALDCTSTGTAWYYQYAVTNNITFDGAAVCATPVAQQYKSLAVWANSFNVATDACNGELGLVAGNSCINLYQLICFSVTFVCLVFGIVALVLVIWMRKSTLRAKMDNSTRGNMKEKSNGNAKGRGKKESNAWA